MQQRMILSVRSYSMQVWKNNNIFLTSVLKCFGLGAASCQGCLETSQKHVFCNQRVSSPSPISPSLMSFPYSGSAGLHRPQKNGHEMDLCFQIPHKSLQVHLPFLDKGTYSNYRVRCLIWEVGRQWVFQQVSLCLQITQM